MNKRQKSAVIKKIAKHRGQYYVTLGMLENNGACHGVRNAIAKRLKLGEYPASARWDHEVQHPKRDEPILITEKLLRKVMGKSEHTSVAFPWQVVNHLGNADYLYGSELNHGYNGRWDYEGYNHGEHVDKVVSLFREWGYIE